jgi:hypothetical protein
VLGQYVENCCGLCKFRLCPCKGSAAECKKFALENPSLVNPRGKKKSDKMAAPCLSGMMAASGTLPLGDDDAILDDSSAAAKIVELWNAIFEEDPLVVSVEGVYKLTWRKGDGQIGPLPPLFAGAAVANGIPERYLWTSAT